MKKRIVLFSIVLILIGGMLSGSYAEVPKTKLVYLATSATSGMYPMEVALCEAMSRHPNIHVAVQAVGNATKTTQMVAAGQAQMGLTTVDALGRMYHGLMEFKGQEQKYKDLRFLFPTVMHVQCMVVTENIKNWKDLNGQPVGLLRGSGGKLTQFLLDANGIVPKSYWQSLETEMIIERLRTKSVVSYLGKGGKPDAMITRIITEVPGTHFLSVSKEMYAKMDAKYPGQLGYTVLPANTYPRQTKDVPTTGYAPGSIARKDVPEAVVYEAVKNVYAERKKIAATYASSFVFLDMGKYILEFATIPLHPGVVKFMRKDLKMTVPDKLIPPEMK